MDKKEETTVERAHSHEAARAKPLVLWIAREIGLVTGATARELGVIYTNGRDSRAMKEAKLIISKRERCSLSKVALFDFGSASGREQIKALMAEELHFNKLNNAADMRALEESMRAPAERK